MENIKLISIVAKLLATENINVELRNVKTPSANISTRTLSFPKMKEDISQDVLNLFISHECSHFLNTPNIIEDKEIFDKIINNVISKDVLNIVEDYRVDYLIKRKYPGLKKMFSNAYTELFDKGFFGYDKDNISEANFIDKLNITLKMGPRFGLKFSEEESAWIKRIHAARKFDEIVQISEEITGYIFDQEAQEEYNDIFNINKELNDYNENDDVQPANKSVPLDVENDEEEDYESSKRDSTSSSNSDPTRSHTLEVFNDKFEEFLSDDLKDTIYISIPKLNPEDHIVPYKELEEIIGDFVWDGFYEECKEYKSFLDENKNIIDYMVMEFGLKKNADRLKKAKISTKGEIDPNKLFSYKFSDNIFLSIKNIGNVQSHGFVFYLDWSGSMFSCIESVIKQLIILCEFCRKSNIPFEVYAYSTEFKRKGDMEADKRMKACSPRNIYDFRKYYEDYPKETLITRHFSLLNFISSKMNNKSYTNMCKFLLSMKVFQVGRDQYIGIKTEGDDIFNYILRRISLDMGGTPLNETIIVSGKIMEMFQKENNVDKAYNIFLTDGISSANYYINSEYKVKSFYTEDKHYIFKDEESKNLIDGKCLYNKIPRAGAPKFYRESYENKFIANSIRTTKVFLDFYNKLYDNISIGFYVGSRKEVKETIDHINAVNNSQRQFYDTKSLYEGIVIKDFGYKTYYIMETSSFMVKKPDIDLISVDKGINKTTIKKFTNAMKVKKLSRILLQKFIKEIS